MSRSFDADAKTAELLEAPVTIGGQTFHPARLTPDVRREQITIATNSAKLAREAGLGEDGDKLADDVLDKRVDAIGSIDGGVYEQLRVLLADEHGQSPALDHLRGSLDHRVAGELLGWLLQDEEEPGEDKPTPATSSD